VSFNYFVINYGPPLSILLVMHFLF